MPLYEYQCSNCAHRFERIVKFSDAPLTTCPQCGMETIEQMISAPAVQFKGSGWYVTDYAHKNSALSSASAKQDGGSDSASASKEGSNGNGGSSAASNSGSSEKSSSNGGNSASGSSGSDSGSSAKSGSHARGSN